EHHACYYWIDAQRHLAACIGAKVNQRPPTYCVLDESVDLQSFPGAKYLVLWSHWELAEMKMRQFLTEAARRAGCMDKLVLDEQPLRVIASPRELMAGCLDDVQGLYLDQWVQSEVSLCLPGDGCRSLRLSLDVPAGLAEEDTTQVAVHSTTTAFTVTLQPGVHDLLVPLDPAGLNPITLAFTGGFTEPGGTRTLYARWRALTIG
ncbi:MAG: hypothetical protein WDA75_18580, partial [Candidatus Latescibacterota bacterium]